jgi:hypothetical protein
VATRHNSRHPFTSFTNVTCGQKDVYPMTSFYIPVANDFKNSDNGVRHDGKQFTTFSVRNGRVLWVMFTNSACKSVPVHLLTLRTLLTHFIRTSTCSSHFVHYSLDLHCKILQTEVKVSSRKTTVSYVSIPLALVATFQDIS